MPDHCRKYALSDPKDKDFQSICTHEHLDTCDRCESLTSVLNEVESAVQEMSSHDVALDLKEELTFVTSQAKKKILAWKSHLLRCINQDDARSDVLDSLDEKSVYLVQDWAMKYLPRKYRESQSDWFAKRGIPWHITVAIRKNADQEYESMSFVHVFKGCTQDSFAVLAIIKDLIVQLKKLMPQLQRVYYRQDNAGCYHSGPTIVGASFKSQFNGVAIKQLDFSDPQGGKGPCDRKAASIKSHMRVHLNEGHNIETAKEMVEAIQSAGGISGVSVTLSDGVTSGDSTSLSAVKLEGVSLFSNIEYIDEENIRVWKAYGIGPGKKKLLSSLVSTKNKDVTIPDLLKSSESTINNNVSDGGKFITAKLKSKTVEDVQEETASSESESGCTADELLFSCPEEGCVKTYQRFSALQLHLDIGKHQRALENETLFDRAACGYAVRLEEQFSNVPQMQQFTKTKTIGSKPSLPMGWALKSSETKRFSEKQKSYLIAKFRVGEKTGQKANAASVAKDMMTARDTDGNRLFSNEEFLTSKQITGFFSRLASKKALPEKISDLDFEQHDAEAEAVFNELGDLIMHDVGLTHPIFFENLNLCEHVANSTLSKFAIQMLKKICENFDISTEEITAKRKAPYISRIVEFCQKNCTCCN